MSPHRSRHQLISPSARLALVLFLLVAASLASCGRIGRATTAAPSPAAARTDYSTLRRAIDQRIAGVAGAQVAVWLQDLGTGDTLALNATTSFHAASTMKVPVMIELFRRADAGRLRLDSAIILQNRFASIVDGSPFTLDAGDDSDSSLYAKIGQPVTLRELNTRMIMRSSNLATNAVIELLDARTANATAHALGATTIQVRRGVEDTKAFNAGLNNTTSARDLGVLMAAIAQNRAASTASCAAMRDILLRQEFNTEIPAGVPPGTPVAHKTGWITGTTHDAAIVYPPRRAPYVLVIHTRAIPQRDVAERLMADISREVWTAVVR
ncbi:MAG: serine hydrolase [Gemmatimonadetes bacterium]|nr:serine hydrolase [Gemmatimonadota bacterium]